jgi:hypothetical protein
MWGVNPSFMCNIHLIAEHREMHMLAGMLQKHGRLLEAQVRQGICEPGRATERHDYLASEMTMRGMRHRSPMQELPKTTQLPAGYVCEVVGHLELLRRCTSCRDRHGQRTYVFLRSAHQCGDDCAERMRRDMEARPRVDTGIAKERKSSRS